MIPMLDSPRKKRLAIGIRQTHQSGRATAGRRERKLAALSFKNPHVSTANQCNLAKTIKITCGNAMVLTVYPELRGTGRAAGNR